ncbi:pyridoxal phosphate-dependent aminotransferase, partial [Streptomyces sp. NPDC006422]
MRQSEPTAPTPGPARARAPEGRGPVRYGPPLPEPGLPVLPELAAVAAGAAGRAASEPPGGPPALLEAACGYWRR